jgi:UDP-N-acetylglucosamine 1-carboxyvinyltransferase
MSAKQSIDFLIHGGKKLSGSVRTNTSKNGAMGLLSASLLNKGTTILHGIPRIEEVNRILEVLQSIQVKTEWKGANTLVVDASSIDLDKINYESANKTRTILMFIGSLANRFDSFRLPHSQGCKLGKRSIATHKFGLEKLGIEIDVDDMYYNVTNTHDPASRVVLFESSDTASENVIIAAAGIPQTSELRFVSPNYMVQDVCGFMKALGAEVEGLGTHHVTITGKNEYNREVEYYNSEDPIEAMMWIAAALCTKSELTIERVPINFLEIELEHLRKMGAQFERGEIYLSENGFTELIDLMVKPSDLKAISEKISAKPYPGINPDNLPFFVPICALAEGQSLIHDWMFENRAIYFMELTRLGANMHLGDPHRVFIEGVEEFDPAQVVCPPALRPAMIVLLAMLAAPGESILRNVYSIKRGYQEIAERLNQLGADVQVIG